MHHMEFSFGFFAYLIDWFGLSGGSSVNYGPIAGVNYGPIGG